MRKVYRSRFYRSSNIGKIRDRIVEWLDLVSHGLNVIFNTCESGKSSGKEQGENIEIRLELHDKLGWISRPEMRTDWTSFIG